MDDLTRITRNLVQKTEFHLISNLKTVRNIKAMLSDKIKRIDSNSRLLWSRSKRDNAKDERLEDVTDIKDIVPYIKANDKDITINFPIKRIESGPIISYTSHMVPFNTDQGHFSSNMDATLLLETNKKLISHAAFGHGQLHPHR